MRILTDVLERAKQMFFKLKPNCQAGQGDKMRNYFEIFGKLMLVLAAEALYVLITLQKGMPFGLKMLLGFGLVKCVALIFAFSSDIWPNKPD